MARKSKDQKCEQISKICSNPPAITNKRIRNIPNAINITLKQTSATPKNKFKFQLNKAKPATK